MEYHIVYNEFIPSGRWKKNNPLTEVRGGNILQSTQLASTNKCSHCSAHVRYDCWCCCRNYRQMVELVVERHKATGQYRAYSLSPSRWPFVI